MTEESAYRALAAYTIQPKALTQLTHGLINQTYKVDAQDGTYVLQQLHPIFGPEVHFDIEAITQRLATQGLQTPRLIKTSDGHLWTTLDSRHWRVMTWLEGETVLRFQTPQQCREAGASLGRFHRALLGFNYTFRHQRLGVHDTAKHLRLLSEVLDQHRSHDEYSKIAPVAQDILERAARLQPIAPEPSQIVHGDPKASNLLLNPGNHQAIAWVDLDTLAVMPVAIELGDALRSWCNPHGEDEAQPELNTEFFLAAIRGYAVGSLDINNAQPHELPAELLSQIIPATETISLELAARFARDALEESYFGWDSKRYARAAHHLLIRAQGQLNLAIDLAHKKDALQRSLEET